MTCYVLQIIFKGVKPFNLFILQDCAWGTRDIDKNQMPNTAKLLRLAFHDCAPYIAEDGSTYGGVHCGSSENFDAKYYILCRM